MNVGMLTPGEKKASCRPDTEVKLGEQSSNIAIISQPRLKEGIEKSPNDKSCEVLSSAYYSNFSAHAKWQNQMQVNQFRVTGRCMDSRDEARIEPESRAGQFL